MTDSNPEPSPTAAVKLPPSTLSVPPAPSRPHPVQASQPLAPSETVPAPPRPKKRILLADDDPGVRETLGRLLQAEQYEVLLAHDGNEAAAQSVNGRPDLVLLDLNMPDRDGWSAFRFLDAAQPMLPIIIITARPHQFPQAEEMGADALMEKPLNLPVLLEAIRGLVAEPGEERTRRLIDPHFKTRLLR